VESKKKQRMINDLQIQDERLDTDRGILADVDDFAKKTNSSISMFP